MQKIDLHECKVTNAQTMVCKKTTVTFSCIDYDMAHEGKQDSIPVDRVKQEGAQKDVKQ